MKSLAEKSAVAWKSISSSFNSAGVKVKKLVQKVFSSSKKVDQVLVDVQNLDVFLQSVSKRQTPLSMSQASMDSLPLSSRPFLGKGKFEVKAQDSSEVVAARVSMLSKDLLELSNMKKRLDMSMRENQRRSGDKIVIVDRQKYDRNVKTIEKDGYNAIQLASIEINKDISKINKSQRKIFSSIKIKPKKIIKEFRVDPENTLEVGTKLDVSHFQKDQ